MSDIVKRWEERVIPNGWDEMGAEGARLYLQKYGKNIGTSKLKLFAEYAIQQGCDDFAREIIKNIKE